MAPTNVGGYLGRRNSALGDSHFLPQIALSGEIFAGHSPEIFAIASIAAARAAGVTVGSCSSRRSSGRAEPAPRPMSPRADAASRGAGASRCAGLRAGPGRLERPSPRGSGRRRRRFGRRAAARPTPAWRPWPPARLSARHKPPKRGRTGPNFQRANERRHGRLADAAQRVAGVHGNLGQRVAQGRDELGIAGAAPGPRSRKQRAAAARVIQASGRETWVKIYRRGPTGSLDAERQARFCQKGS